MEPGKGKTPVTVKTGEGEKVSERNRELFKASGRTREGGRGLAKLRTQKKRRGKGRVEIGVAACPKNPTEEANPSSDTV